MMFGKNERPLIWIRGAGDIATGVGVRLLNAGFRIVFSEIKEPTVIRRTVAFASGVYEGSVVIEGYTGICCGDLGAVERALEKNQVPVFIGDEKSGLTHFRPYVFVEGTIRKKKTQLPRDLVPYTIALGPGFSAPEDVDGIVETMRGHSLGRVIWQGAAIPNTGIPGKIGGYAQERVIHAPEDGRMNNLKNIGDFVAVGDAIAILKENSLQEEIEVRTTISGILRGIIYEGLWVEKGMKIADVDPRCNREHCFSISDKARSVGGGVLEAIMHFMQL